MGSQDTDASPGYLRARVLRYWVCIVLANEDRTMSVDELVASLDAYALRISGL